MEHPAGGGRTAVVGAVRPEVRLGPALLGRMVLARA